MTDTDKPELTTEIIDWCIRQAHAGIAAYSRLNYDTIAEKLEPFKEDIEEGKQLLVSETPIAFIIRTCEAGLTLTSPKFAYPRIIEDLEDLKQTL